MDITNHCQGFHLFVFFTLMTISLPVRCGMVKVSNQEQSPLAPGKTCKTSEECVENALCSSKICSCANGYFPDLVTGTCRVIRGFGEPCIDNIHCNRKDKRLVCNITSRFCDCDQHSVFFPEDGSCRIRVGRKCEKNSSCVPNAICFKTPADAFHRCTCIKPTISSIAVDDFCYFPVNKKCFGDLNRAVTSRTCAPGLHCRNRMCRCPFKDHQTYNKKTKTCLSFIGGPCNTTVDCLDENAACFQAQETEPLQCWCRRGFVTVKRECEIAAGENCSQLPGTPKCDTTAPMECSTNGICECSDYNVYDNRTSTCLGLVGARCTGPDVKDEAEKCVENAICKTFRGHKQDGYGLCSCEPPYKAGADRKCAYTSTRG